MFFKKKEKITVWSVIPGFEKLTCLEPARKYIPKWFKKVQQEKYSEYKNVKNCPSFPWWFTQGYVLPLWCDLQVFIKNNDVCWSTPLDTFQFVFHTKDQFEDYVPKHIEENILCIMKPKCPLRVRTPEGWRLQQLPMFYEYNEIFSTLPGIIPSSRLFEINPQLAFNKNYFTEKNNYTVLIPKGTPLAMYVPIPEKPLELDVVEETPELKKLDDLQMIAVNTKFNYRWKDYLKQKLF